MRDGVNEEVNLKVIDHLGVLQIQIETENELQDDPMELGDSWSSHPLRKTDFE